MNWNGKPENAAPKPPPYPKGQSSLLQQFLMPSTSSQSSFSCLPHNQEACLYPTNSNSVSQPLVNVRSYITPQISVSNMHNRTVVASQTSVERVTYTNVKGAQQPNYSLQTVSSGVMQNAWMNSTMRNFMPSHTEATVSHKPDGGTNMPYIHVPQSQLITSDTYSVQLQTTPSNSVRVPVTYQGNQGLNHSIPDELVGWTQCSSNELTYPDYRPPPKQYPYLPQSFVQDTSVQKQNFVSSTSLQVKNHQLPPSTQTLPSKHPVPVSSYQCAAETNKRLPASPYSCRYGSQNVQNSQSVSRHLPVEVPQSTEMHSSEKKKDAYKVFEQQWQNTSRNFNTIGKFCELKINTKQSYNDSAGSSGDGVQTLVQNNQEERKYSCNPSTNQIIDTNVTKEKLVRDIKSLVEIKKKFSELARKIKINKDILMANGCSKTANTYTEPTRHSEFSAKEMSAKRDSRCSMELLATCLSLWKNQPPKTTEENVPKPLEEKQYSVSRTSTTAIGCSNPTNEVHVKNFCSGVRNPQKMTTSSQTVLSVLTPIYESSDVAVGKGTELQIAVVSPLILSDINTIPGKEVAPEVVPETVYPVVKEGSVCSLQNQQEENSTVTAALPCDITGAVASNPESTELSLPVHEVKQHKPTQSDLAVVDSGLGKHSPLGADALPNPKDSNTVSGPMLQIESICSLAEGDASYNSQIAEIFNSVQNEHLKLSPNQQAINSQQEEQVDDIAENKDCSFQEDKCMPCTDVPHEVTEQPEPLQPSEAASSEYVKANRETLEESSKENTGEKETTKNMCSPAVVQQDPQPQETGMAISKSGDSLPVVNEINDESEPVSYLHDQLSELLKEFPYGIETIARPEVYVRQQKTHEIVENQTGSKTGNVSGENADQIKITVLNSEQIKELFPEEDQLRDLDRLAELKNTKDSAEIKSLCGSQVPREESYNPGMLDLEKDKIHCCALGWLSMVYEGVPQCQCSTTAEKNLCSLEITNCKQGEQACNSGITIFEINPISGNPKSPLTQEAEEGHFSDKHVEKIKTSETKDSSSSRVEQELTGNFSMRCHQKDKDKSETKQNSSLKIEQKASLSSKCDKPDPLKSNKKPTPEAFHVVTSNSDKNMPAFSKQDSQKSLQKKHTFQDSDPVKAHAGLLPNKDPCRRKKNLVQSVSPEKKIFKFKAGSSKLKYFEKRKTDHVLISDVEIKKKKYEKQEQNKNAGGTLKLYSTLTEPNERACAKEKVTNSEPSDSKGSSSKSNRVITVQEYLQRQKDRLVHGNDASKNIGVENVPCDSEHMKFSKNSVSQSVSAETKKETEHNSTSHGQNLKTHHSEEAKTYSMSRNNSKGRFDGKQPDIACIDKTKLERLTSMSNKSSQISPQVKERRKQYLNRVAFKCTERESICLTKLDSASKKLRKEKEKNRACTVTNDDTDKPMLEFKLCPDVLLKNTCSIDKQDDPRPGPEKEQASVRVSGIKTTKEDWLKCIPTRTKMPESSEEIDRTDSRLAKRSFSADEFEMLQNPVKDSNVMFRTYKKMYLEKRSRSLGSSPVK